VAFPSLVPLPSVAVLKTMMQYLLPLTVFSSICTCDDPYVVVYEASQLPLEIDSACALLAVITGKVAVNKIRDMALRIRDREYLREDLSNLISPNVTLRKSPAHKQP
jgi:hypothetical protein